VCEALLTRHEGALYVRETRIGIGLI